MNLKRFLCAAGLILIILGWAGPPAGGVEQTPGFNVIQRAFLREDFEAVSAMARMFLTDHPDVTEAPRVRLWLALSLARLEQATDALRELDALKARLQPSDALWPELLYWEGEISRRALKMVRAKLAYQRLIEQHPSSTWVEPALLGLGLVAMHHQAYDEALGAVRDAAARQPETPLAGEAKLLEGMALLRLKRFEESITVFQALLDQLQDQGLRGQAAFHLGEGLTGLARYDEAIEAYRRARAIAPESAWATLAWFGEGWADYRADRCEASVKMLEHYLQLEEAPQDHQAEALFAQGSCWAQLENDPQALAAFRQILAQSPRDPLAIESGVAMVEIYRRREEFLAAKELLHALLQWPITDTTRAQLQLQLGRLALDQGNAAQAATVFRLAADTPDPAIRQMALSGVGDVELFLGNAPSAQQHYREAASLVEGSPHAAYAAYQLGRIALQQGALDDAMAAFRTLAANEDPELSANARLALVIAFLARGDLDGARSLVETIRRGPRETIAARAAYYEALLTLDEGNSREVTRLCLEAIAQAPRSDEALEARLLLVDLRLRETTAWDVMTWLKRVLATERLPMAHRAKLAKQLGDLARNERRLAEAIRWYELAEGWLPSLRGELAYRVASCYEEGGDVPLAIERYRLIELPPWRVRGRMAAAKLLERDGRLAEAEALLAPLAREPIPEAAVIQEQLTAWHQTTERSSHD